MLRTATTRIRLTARVHVLSTFIARNVSESNKGDTPTNATQSNENAKDDSSTKSNPLQPWPDGVNPHTGERGGPAGPEPTRFGDWERKGRVSDF